MTQINQGRGLFEKFGDENKAMEKGQKISLEPGPDGKYEIVDICKYCEKHDEYFKEPSVIQNHIKNERIKYLKGNTQNIESLLIKVINFLYFI